MALETLENPERNAILAGLRLLQLYNDGRVRVEGSDIQVGIDDIYSCGGDEETLGNEAIDTLCERLNCEGLSYGEAGTEG